MPDLSPIEAHERAGGRIFGDEYAFEIPVYQRPYAWEVEQVRDLLTDLGDAMDGDGVYFLGSIVLIKAPGVPQSKVVDGQQRLTTLTILLSVLRDVTNEPDRRISRGAYIYQKANPDSGAKDQYRLLLREQDRVFFKQRVQVPGATAELIDPATLEGSRQRIAENVAFLRRQLEGWSEAKRDRLVAFIIQRCYLVVVSVPTPEAARRIFTVLNARGLDLTPTDVLKALLLERAGPVLEADLAKRWEAVETALGRERFVELFGHIRMIYERAKPRTGLEEAFPSVVPPFSGDPDAFVSKTLEPLADAWELLEDDSEVRTAFGPEAARAVRSLGRVDNKDWLPPALLRLWKREPDDAAKVAAFLVSLERLTYYLFVVRADVNERIARYARVINAIDSVAAAPQANLELLSSEQALFVAALDGPLYRKARVCKPVLQRLDEALAAGGASYDQLVSIEHVLPQTVGTATEWADLFPDQEERDAWTHRLANLVFLTRRINVRASNWDFERKKKVYFASKEGTSPFPLTQEVLQAAFWTPEHLRQRQARLVAKLCEVWNLASPSIASSTQTDEIMPPGAVAG